MDLVHIFVTFDLENANSEKYDQFYEKAKKFGFTRFIPGSCTSSKKDAVLPNTTIFKDMSNYEDAVTAKDKADTEVKSIYNALNLKGKYAVIVSKNWRTNKI